MKKNWHAKNRMPKNASVEQRVRWHEEHLKACGCRPCQRACESGDREEPDGQSATDATNVVTV